MPRRVSFLGSSSDFLKLIIKFPRFQKKSDHTHDAEKLEKKTQVVLVDSRPCQKQVHGASKQTIHVPWVGTICHCYVAS